MVQVHRVPIRERLSYFAVCLILIAASTTVCQQVQTANDRQSARPLNLLVLGDSILWGQGLKTEHKPSYHVKVWLEKQTGRRVVERMEAHSGALIDGSSLNDKRRSSNREVNLGVPTIHEEIDNALSFYSDPSQVDVVLVSGCGNDVGVQNLLNAENTGAVDDMTEAKCGKPVENLLRRITTVFPAAQVILTGYYPFFSNETRNDFVVKGFAQRFFKTRLDGGARMSSKEVFERLKVNSRQWHEVSNARLSEAVRRVNSEIGQERVTFAKIEFPAVYSFAAPKTHLWGFNRSPLRMALLFLSFGKMPLPSNDEVRAGRIASCNALYKKPQNEGVDQKRERKALRLYCRYAALGHPNKKGAVLYADAVTHALKSTRLVAASANGSEP
jgi:lysophospholipase L1-like esterase